MSSLHAHDFLIWKTYCNVTNKHETVWFLSIKYIWNFILPWRESLKTGQKLMWKTLVFSLGKIVACDVIQENFHWDIFNLSACVRHYCDNTRTDSKNTIEEGRSRAAVKFKIQECSKKKRTRECNEDLYLFTLAQWTLQEHAEVIRGRFFIFVYRTRRRVSNIEVWFWLVRSYWSCFTQNWISPYKRI